MTTHKHNHDIHTSIKSPTNRLAHMMAKIILSFNIPINQWIEQLKFHMVILAQSNNPKHNTIELAAMTGLDRRYVTKTLKTGEIKRTNSKIDKVLEKIRQICHYKHTDTIQIYGKRNTFASTCKTISSTSLSTKAIASELIRRGKIIDQGEKYKIISFNDTLDKSLLFIDYIRSIIFSLKEKCIKNNNKYISKNDCINIFETVNNNNQNQSFKNKDIFDYLIKQEIIADNGDNYKIINLYHTLEVTKKNINLELISSQLTLLSNTILFNAIHQDDKDKCYQFKTSSTRINPTSFRQIKANIIQILRKTNKNIFKMMESYEEQVPYGTFPEIGASLFGFDQSNSNKL